MHLKCDTLFHNLSHPCLFIPRAPLSSFVEPSRLIDDQQSLPFLCAFLVSNNQALAVFDSDTTRTGFSIGFVNDTGSKHQSHIAIILPSSYYFPPFCHGRENRKRGKAMQLYFGLLSSPVMVVWGWGGKRRGKKAQARRRKNCG